MKESVFLLVTMVLSSSLTYLVMRQSVQLLREALVDQRDQVRELLNRIQSKDLHAFATMQANTAPVSTDNEPQYIRSDEAEATRMMEMYGAMSGIGDVVYSEEEIDLAADLGLRLDD